MHWIVDADRAMLLSSTFDRGSLFVMISTQELLDTSVAQLRTLSAFLDEQLCQRDGGSVRARRETKACNEILQSLRGLIKRVQGTRPHALNRTSSLATLQKVKRSRRADGV